jgi:hypothetical protein
MFKFSWPSHDVIGATNMKGKMLIAWTSKVVWEKCALFSTVIRVQDGFGQETIKPVVPNLYQHSFVALRSM